VNGTTITVKGMAKGNATLTITASYNTGSEVETSTKTCPVTVISIVKTVTSIAITALPTTTEYAIGSSFNSNGLIVTATYDDASTAAVVGYTLNPANGTVLNNLGTQTITVTYSGSSATFSINVVQNIVTLTSIAITTQPTKLAYYVGDSFSSSGLVVTGTYSDSSTAVLSGYTLSIDDTTITNGTILSTAGSKTVIVAYQGLSTSFGITITAQGSNRYYLVSSSSGIVAGGTYLIVGKNASSGVSYAMSSTQTSTTNRGQVQVSVVNGSPSYVDYVTGAEKIVLEKSGTNWLLKATAGTSDGYLYISSDENSICTSTSSTTSGTAWSISIGASTTYYATIQNVSISTRVLKYNAGSSCFRTYTSGQNSINLYKMG
jgi:hypothetical protein